MFCAPGPIPPRPFAVDHGPRDVGALPLPYPTRIPSGKEKDVAATLFPHFLLAIAVLPSSQVPGSPRVVASNSRRRILQSFLPLERSDLIPGSAVLLVDLPRVHCERESMCFNDRTGKLKGWLTKAAGIVSGNGQTPIRARIPIPSRLTFQHVTMYNISNTVLHTAGASASRAQGRIGAKRNAGLEKEKKKKKTQQERRSALHCGQLTLS